jgi:hypothetical protein
MLISELAVTGMVLALNKLAKLKDGVASAKESALTVKAFMKGPADETGLFHRVIGAGAVLSGAMLVSGGFSASLGLLGLAAGVSAMGAIVLGGGLIGIGVAIYIGGSMLGRGRAGGSP